MRQNTTGMGPGLEGYMGSREMNFAIGALAIAGVIVCFIGENYAGALWALVAFMRCAEVNRILGDVR